MSSGWFDTTEPSLCSYRVNKECRVMDYIGRAHRTCTKHTFTRVVRRGEVCRTSSGWFDTTKPSLCTSLQGKP